MNKINNKIILFFSSFFYAGYFPIASGTFVSFLVSVLVLIFPPNTNEINYIIFSICIFIFGIFGSHFSTIILQDDDPSIVVIDEVCGMLVSLLFIEISFATVFAAFFIFRFFDIVKPFPIRNVEKLKYGFGIMVDDLIAGVFTNILLQIFFYIL